VRLNAALHARWPETQNGATNNWPAEQRWNNQASLLPLGEMVGCCQPTIEPASGGNENYLAGPRC